MEARVRNRDGRQTVLLHPGQGPDPPPVQVELVPEVGADKYADRFESLRSGLRSSLPLFAVKPLLIIYMMSWAVTNSVGTQLWIYKTCTVNFNSSGRDQCREKKDFF